MEKKIAEYESDKDSMMIHDLKQERKIDEFENQVRVLTQQVECLAKALEDSD